MVKNGQGYYVNTWNDEWSKTLTLTFHQHNHELNCYLIVFKKRNLNNYVTRVNSGDI